MKHVQTRHRAKGDQYMAKERLPKTPAVRMLEAAHVHFIPHHYKYIERGGTKEASRQLGIPEHAVIKTLVMQDERGSPFLVLMHGDREVSTKALARALGVKTVTPCDSRMAQRHTGYTVGGISPFGTRKSLPVYAEASLFDLPRILINGGKRGFLVELAPEDLDRLLKPRRVRVGR